MLCGIIDVGSNTMRMSIYQWEDGVIKRLLHKKTMAGLAGYIEDRRMSEHGAVIACSVLKSYLSILDNFGIEERHAFATAPFRDIENTEEIMALIQKEAGICVDILSGRDEALFGFAGAMHDVEMKKGIILDIGGGSTELTVCDGAEIVNVCSMPIGSLNLHKDYVKELMPTKGEMRAIQSRVQEELSQLNLQDMAGYRIICGVGGSIRAATALSNEIFLKSRENTLLTAENLQSMLKIYKKTPNLIIKKVLQIAPDRVHTIIPGMLVLDTVTSAFECRTVRMSRYGVREGYLLKRVVNVKSAGVE